MPCWWGMLLRGSGRILLGAALGGFALAMVQVNLWRGMPSFLVVVGAILLLVALWFLLAGLRRVIIGVQLIARRVR